MLTFSVAANAQNEVGKFTFAPTVGLNLTNITDAGDSKIKPGLVAGVNAEYGVIDKLGVTAGLMFSMQGAKYSSGGYTETMKLNYLNIPILANYYVWKGLAVKAGIQLGFLLSAKETEKADGESETFDFKKECNTFDFAIPVGVSYEFSKFVVDARYNIHVSKIYKKEDGYQPKSRNTVFQLMVGYKF